MATSLFEILQQRRGRVLFASGSNTRNQTAEALARALGSDVMEAASAANALALQMANPADYDVIVNMSACALPEAATLVLSLPLPDPRDEAVRIETFVTFLAEHFRRAKEWSAGVD